MKFTSANTKTGFRMSCQLKCVRCTATTAKGARCRNKVCIGVDTCHAHRTKTLGLAVKKSKIPNAGKGLFATRDFKQNEVIGKYTGDILTRQENNERHGQHPKHDLNAYGVGITSAKKVVDASCNRGLMSLANGSANKASANARYMDKLMQGKVNVRATKKIRKGQEIIVHYGAGYFTASKYHKHKTR